DPVAFEDQYPLFFLAHEVAHQWWGQAVGWRNYHDQWLSEGLAQYFAVLYAAEDRGPELLQSLIGSMRSKSQATLNQGPISLGYRIGHIRNDPRALSSILYNKAAVVIHMLRRYIGDEAFFAGLRKFYVDWRFAKAGADQLQAAFEATSGIKLDRFFEGWVRGFAMPRIELTLRAGTAEAPGVIRIEQDDEPFDFPLTVMLQFADGKSEERTLKVTGRVFEQTVDSPSPLRKVTIKDSLSYFTTR
ncbi:MAG TPA: M1 family aminopeptidase, partial [Vicinamibacterales bacterium]|nr:M1 family aminopeptidase [Vicinamibacterales bacterium]